MKTVTVNDFVVEGIRQLQSQKKLLTTNSRKGMYAPGSVAQVLHRHPEWRKPWLAAKRKLKKRFGDDWFFAQALFLEAVDKHGYGGDFIQVYITPLRDKYKRITLHVAFANAQDALLNNLEGIEILNYMKNLARKHFE